MATLVQDIERPRFLDAPTAGQLSLGGVATPPRPGRGIEPRHDELSQRLRAERAAERGQAQAGPTRGGEATLDELIVGAWEGLSARRPVACPICAGPMQPRAGAAGGACGDCGSQVR